MKPKLGWRILGAGAHVGALLIIGYGVFAPDEDAPSNPAVPYSTTTSADTLTDDICDNYGCGDTYYAPPTSSYPPQYYSTVDEEACYLLPGKIEVIRCLNELDEYGNLTR